MERITSGIDGFDSVIRGGYPKSAATLVTGPVGEEKNLVCVQFLKSALENNGAVLIVLSSISPLEFKSRMENLAIDVEKYVQEGKLKIVDCYSWRIKQVSEGVLEEEEIFLVNRSLSNIGMGFSQAIKSLSNFEIVVAYIELLSPLLKYEDEKKVYEFTQVIIGRLKNSSITSIFTLEKDMQDKTIETALEQLFDGVIEIEITKKRDNGDIRIERKIGVIKMPDVFETEFLNINMTSSGLHILKKGGLPVKNILDRMR